MPRTPATWPKGQKPPVQKPKGAKAKKTLLKESLGLSGWSRLKSFVENEGADKLVEEMSKLKGKDYTTALAAFTEYVKPKLTRTDLEVSGGITETVVTIKGKKPHREGSSILKKKADQGK